MTTVKEAEKFAFATLSVDGLVDFWAGVTILLIGIGWSNEDLMLIATFSALITIPFWRISRKYLSEPRLGSVNLSQVKKARVSRKLLLTALSGSALLGVFAYIAFDPDEIGRNFLQDVIPMLPSFIIALMTLLGGWLFSAPRFFAYAAWVAAAGYYGVVAYGHPSAALMMGSVLPIAGGIYHFFKFTATNPKAEA